jgi:hypothetical protein
MRAGARSHFGAGLLGLTTIYFTEYIVNAIVNLPVSRGNYLK